jgi:5-methylthioadenosine/S-adenosylhomocysteine deaminase
MENTSTLYTADLIYVDDTFQSGVAVLVSGAEIQAVGDAEELKPRAQKVRNFRDQALMPGTVNSHNHSFQSLVRGFADDLPFFDWRDQGIYKYSLDLGPEEIYVGALFAFGEMLTYGVTTVVDFFYLHDDGNENSRAVIRAAKALGIRLVLARTMYDWQQGPAKYRERVEDAAERCYELMDEFDSDPRVTICPAPHSPHAASEAMIRAGVEIARARGGRFHIHVAEGQYEVDMIQERHGLRPMAWLDEIGACNEQMVAVHCVWLDDDEISLMARRGAKLAYNPASNMFLADGITRIREMLDHGIRIGLGTDGACSNNRTSVFDEMRTASLLQKVRLLDSAACRADEVFAMGTTNAGEVLGLPIGRIATGHKADFVALDLNHITLQPVQNLRNNIVYAMAPEAITEVIVDGRTIYSDGELLTIPRGKIVEDVRRVTGNW